MDDPRKILPLGFVLILLLGITSCYHTPQSAIDAMDSAESLMEEHPDSALAIMQTIDSSLLHGRADKARRALLMTMAVDKNLIDTTDFRILQPAIDYYEKHGTPDQRLRTRYYEGRIWMNRGDDDKALNAFLRAAEDSTECTDSLGLALLLLAQAHMSWKEYEFKDFSRYSMKASEIYRHANDSVRYMKALASALQGAVLTSDTTLALSILPECMKGVYLYGHKIEILPYAVIESFPSFKTKEEFLEFANTIQADTLIQYKSGLGLAYAFNEFGEYDKALEHLNKADNSDSIYYNTIRTEILEILEIFRVHWRHIKYIWSKKKMK